MSKLFLNPRFFLHLLSLFASGDLVSQTYSSHNIQLISHITPNMGDFGIDGRRYSSCWAWYQQSKNKEYAISGTSNGTYFIDISAPASPSVSAFVQAAQGCTYREIKTYQKYCYIVSDDGQPLGFQIVDMQNLPSGVSVVYEGSSYFQRAHTLYIDNDKLYLGSVTYSNGSSSMAVYSLATPTAPVLLRRLEQDVPFINTVHDMFVRNDTIYASCAYQGLMVFKFNVGDSTFSTIGSFTGYPRAGYNHSSFLTQNGKHLLFCDEIPSGSPIHFVNVETLTNIQELSSFIPHLGTTPHNPYILGNDFALISCYEDGLYIYDISDPAIPGLVGFFDTHPQTGANTGLYGSINYRGNWGVYPFLPSKLIVANDMQNGVFILDATAAYTTTIKNPVDVMSVKEPGKHSSVLYDPLTEIVHVRYSGTEKSVLLLKNTLGATLVERNYSQAFEEQLGLSNFAGGIYLLQISSGESSTTRKIVVRH